MWEWIQKTLYQQVKNIRVNKSLVGTADADDIVQNVMLHLFQNESIAEEIYKEKKIALLYTLAKKDLYKQECLELNLSNKALLYRIQTILKCCEEHNIAVSPDNAYKISIILNSSDYHYNIKNVRIILTDYANLITQNIFQKGFL